MLQPHGYEFLRIARPDLLPSLRCSCGSERRGVADACSLSEALGDYVGGSTPAWLKNRAVSLSERGGKGYRAEAAPQARVAAMPDAPSSPLGRPA